MGFFNNILDSLSGGITGLVGSGINAIANNSISNKQIQSQKETNATNLQIARETNQSNIDAVNATNQSNIDIMNQQNDWNLDMWNKQNEYNSPQAQRKRLIESGLNPLFYGLDGNSSGSAPVAAATSLQAPQSDIVQQAPVDYSSKINMFSNFVDGAMNINSKLLDYKRQKIQNAILNKEYWHKELENLNFYADNGWKWNTISDKEDGNNPEANYALACRSRFLKAIEKDINESEISSLDLQQKRELSSTMVALGKKQLESLDKDIRNKELSNDYETWKKRLRDEYNIDPNTDWVNNLINVILRDPHSASKIIQSALNAIKTSLNDVYDDFKESPIQDAIDIGLKKMSKSFKNVFIRPKIYSKNTGSW